MLNPRKKSKHEYSSMLIKQEKFDSPARSNLYKSAAYQSKESLTEANILNLKQQHSDTFGHSEDHLSKL